MIVLNRYQQRRPIGGHHYPENGETFTGETVEEVARKLRDARIRNGRPVGDPERDIILWYAKMFPYMVKEDGKTPDTPAPNEDYVRYRSWIHTTWKMPPKAMVTTKEAKIRHEICDKCPMKKPTSWGSSDEAQELARRSMLLRCGISPCGTEGYCACYRWPIETVVFFEEAEKFAANKKDAVIPNECWVGKI